MSLVQLVIYTIGYRTDVPLLQLVIVGHCITSAVSATRPYH